MDFNMISVILEAPTVPSYNPHVTQMIHFMFHVLSTWFFNTGKYLGPKS